MNSTEVYQIIFYYEGTNLLLILYLANVCSSMLFWY